jgi:hypothetical protein
MNSDVKIVMTPASAVSLFIRVKTPILIETLKTVPDTYDEEIVKLFRKLRYKKRLIKREEKNSLVELLRFKPLFYEMFIYKCDVSWIIKKCGYFTNKKTNECLELSRNMNWFYDNIDYSAVIKNSGFKFMIVNHESMKFFTRDDGIVLKQRNDFYYSFKYEDFVSGYIPFIEKLTRELSETIFSVVNLYSALNTYSVFMPMALSIKLENYMQELIDADMGNLKCIQEDFTYFIDSFCEHKPFVRAPINGFLEKLYSYVGVYENLVKMILYRWFVRNLGVIFVQKGTSFQIGILNFAALDELRAKIRHRKVRYGSTFGRRYGKMVSKRKPRVGKLVRDSGNVLKVQVNDKGKNSNDEDFNKEEEDLA